MIADASALLRRTGTRQLVKFCFVGASSTLIDKGTLWLLLSVTPRTPWWISASMSFCLAVTNGFVWSRRWTFLSGGCVSADILAEPAVDSRCGGYRFLARRDSLLRSRPAGSGDHQRKKRDGYSHCCPLVFIVATRGGLLV